MKRRELQMTVALCAVLTCVCGTVAQRTDRSQVPPARVPDQRQTARADDRFQICSAVERRKEGPTAF